jgi:uncharacterized membrane protein
MKQKKTLEFNILNLTEETPKEVVKLQGVAKGLLGTLAGVTWFASNPNNAGILLIVGAIITELIGCLKVKKIQYE